MHILETSRKYVCRQIFVPVWWCPEGNSQTILMTLLPKRENKVMAPINGFYNAKDYYQKCSARYFLDAIKLPVALIHSKQDPLCPIEVFPMKIAQPFQQRIKNLKWTLSTLFVSKTRVSLSE